MKKIITFAIISIFVCNINGQDTIKTIYGTSYGEVLKVGGFLIKYKPLNEEKIRRIEKTDVKFISFANGERKFFNKYQEKVIIAKDAPIENRYGYGSETVYYFYSSDRKSIEVDRTTYNVYKVGYKYIGKWK